MLLVSLLWIDFIFRFVLDDGIQKFKIYKFFLFSTVYVLLWEILVVIVECLKFLSWDRVNHCQFKFVYLHIYAQSNTIYVYTQMSLCAQANTICLQNPIPSLCRLKYHLYVRVNEICIQNQMVKRVGDGCLCVIQSLYLGVGDLYWDSPCVIHGRDEYLWREV